MDEATSCRKHRVAGVLMMALGGLHTLATVAGGGDALVDMARAGLFDAAGRDWYRLAVFWSLQFGALLFLAGWLLHRRGAGRTLFARPIGCFVVVVFTLGAVVVPLGGFWLGILLGAWMIARGSDR
jgi:hypothetical protein